MWWDAKTISIYWMVPEPELPIFQKKRQELLYTSDHTIQNVFSYPLEQYLLIQEDNTLYALELDGRGGTRNKQLIYKGEKLSFYVSPGEKTLYLFDNGTILTIDLP